MIYYSVLTLDELADLPKSERIKFIGVIQDGLIISPALCYECEGTIILSRDLQYSQCSECGIVNDVYFYDNYNPWKATKVLVEYKGMRIVRSDV